MGAFPFEKRPEFYWDEFHATKEEVVKLVKLGKELGIELIPQLNIFGRATAARVSVGKHVVLDRYPEFAPLFEPDGWTWRVSNPEAPRVLTDCVLELYETFDRPRFFHLGCDEAYSAATGFETRRGGAYVDALADWLVGFRDVLAERNCRVMIRRDMPIDSKDFNGYTAGGGPKTRGLIDRLPKDVVCDWQYSAPKKDETWPTTTFFQEEKGFDVLVRPWRDVAGIRGLATKAAETNGMGVLRTTRRRFYGATCATFSFTARKPPGGRATAAGILASNSTAFSIKRASRFKIKNTSTSASTIGKRSRKRPARKIDANRRFPASYSI